MLFCSTSNSLLQCSVGDELQIRVGGDFFYAPPTPNGATDLLLIAGGVGINPLISMLRHHIWLISKATPSEDCHGNDASTAHLLYSAKDESELIFKVCCCVQFSKLISDTQHRPRPYSQLFNVVCRK